MTYEVLRVGEKLVQYRKATGLSQAELADLLKVSRQAISKWERDEALPDLDNLKYLAQTLNFSVDDLLGIERKSALDTAEQLNWQSGSSVSCGLNDNCGLDQEDQEVEQDLSTTIYHAIGKNDKSEVSEWWADAFAGTSALIITPLFFILLFKGFYLSFLLFFLIPPMYYLGKLLPLLLALYRKWEDGYVSKADLHR